MLYRLFHHNWHAFLCMPVCGISACMGVGRAVARYTLAMVRDGHLTDRTAYYGDLLTDRHRMRRTLSSEHEGISARKRQTKF